MSTATEAPVVAVRDLRIVFPTLDGEVTAVDGISFEVPAGGALGIVGESGSGKSAAALALLGLHRGTTARVSGEVEVAGVAVNAATDRRLRAMRGNDIAMVFQDPMTSLHPQYTIGNQLVEAYRIHRPDASAAQARARAVESLERVGIPDAARRVNAFPHEFSGGMRQRALIAMGLMCDPKVLLADEPTTALDVTVQAQILDLLDDLRRDLGMSLILVSHDLAVVAGSVDDVLVMQHGKIVERGGVRTVLSAPEHPYTRALLAAVPRVDVSRAQRRARMRAERAQRAEGAGAARPEARAGAADGTGAPAAAPPAPAADPAPAPPAPEPPASRPPASPPAGGPAADPATSSGVAAPPDAPLLSVRNVRMRFTVRGGLLGRGTDFYAVDDVSFDLHQGETLGIVGESGSGKSTLARVVLRLLRPTEGSVVFQGRDITRLPERHLRPLRRDMQIVFQNPYSSLNPRRPIGEAIGAGLRVQGGGIPPAEIRRRVGDLLERVGLEPGHYNRFPHAFSGGQRQRIAIARALILRPKLVICDEPVSALDVSTQDQVLRLLDELQDDFNLTYIFVAHDLAVVRQVSDRVLVMKEGAVVESGAGDAVYTAPAHPYTRRLLASAPVLDPDEARRLRADRHRLARGD
ncbi:ABC transporter ATP-binding protein [Streptomonospora sp. S1-112]|uniref:ABC transporter ATP-binding protein n=1 Tax=Streptomonospora mangrovi TaxID=2883123 RepID=A0A9X3NP96_9ACTN|nr:ABC transporter ATP-binding protein [Streptomonospora mangrovi]MDA0566680.1 ABC transporter ATP-binding protein [Streptomonospora mangrovi]